MRRRTLALAIAAIALVLAACEPPPGMSIHHFEEFLDDSAQLHRWKVENSNYGSDNHEHQWHQPQNIEVSGGTMTITARREAHPSGYEFTSGFIGSRTTAASGTFYPKFGRYEIRARIPHGQGLWPAFWLRRHGGATHAEVDVMEYFHSTSPGHTKQTLHLGEDNTFQPAPVFFESPRPDADTEFHTWAVDIVPEGDDVRFTFYVDGAQTSTYLDTDPTWNDPRIDPDHFWDIAVNLSVGGNWTGHPDELNLGRLHPGDRWGHLDPDSPGQCSIGWTRRFLNYPDNCPQSYNGHAIRRAEFPAVMEVDYVRVFRWDGDPAE